ncbi:MAG: TonB-dependent receptor [Pseudomonadota bacterium]
MPIVKRRKAATLRGCLVVLCGLLNTVEVQAQTDDAEDAVELDNVSVIGGKLNRDLQNTYTSTDVVEGQTLDDLHLLDLREAANMQGNVYVAPVNNGNNGIAIRGINSEGIGEPGANLRPLMTLTVDGAPQSFEGIRRGHRGTWDLKQIEITKGPQSTLHGRNALAGAIAIETNDPTPYWEGAARIGLSDLDMIAPAAMVSGPIGESVTFRLSAESLDGEKDIEYTEPSNEFLDDDEYSNVRGKILIEPESVPGLAIKLTLSETVDHPAVTAVSATDPFDRVFDGAETAGERRENDLLTRIADVSYTIDENWSLRSITARTDTDANITGAGTIFDLPYGRDEIRADADTTQELRFLYENKNSAWSGMIGLFYGEFENDRDSLITLGGAAFQDIESNRQDKSYAVFGETYWRFSDRWQLVVGGRYTVDSSDFFFDNQVDDEQRQTTYEDDALLPKVGLIRDIDEQSSIALTVTRGYRSGFVQRDRRIDPEFLDSYELAYRSVLLDNQLRFNANLFYYDWVDQQVTVPVGPLAISFTENAGSSTVYGAELMTRWTPRNSAHSLGASIGLLKTKLDDFRSELVGLDFSGNEFPESPEYSGSVWLTSRYRNNWFSSAQIMTRGSAFASTDLANNENTKVDGHTIVNVRVGYETDDYSFIAGVDNLTDEEYLTGRSSIGSVTVGDPRTFHLTLAAYF